MSKPISPRRRLQVCRTNRLALRTDLLELLAAQGCVVELEECLDQCTRCEGCAFALVGGRFQFAPGPDELVRRIRRGRRGNDTTDKGGGLIASQ